MTRILWHSNAPWAASGYGQQTAYFTPRLAKEHDLYISANYGLDGAPIVWNGIPVLPGLGQSHGNEAIPGHVGSVFKEPREGLLLTLYDVGPFSPDVFKHLNAACWCPVDHNPATPSQVAFFRESQAIPLAMSHYGEEQLAEFDPIYVPHGVDTEVYKPQDASLMRERMGVPKDGFLVGMVAANKGRPSRKCFQQALEAFRFFRQKHENAYLYLHTVIAPEWAGGEDLAALLGSLEIPEDAIKLPNQYRQMFHPEPPHVMAQLYNCFDVLFNPAMGEGFGVPIAEANACGVPAIVTDFSAMPEVLGAGWKVKGRAFWTGQHSWMSIPDVGELVEALEEAYSLPDAKREALSIQARQHALQFDVDTVFLEHLLPALEEVEERIGMRKPEKLKVAA